MMILLEKPKNIVKKAVFLVFCLVLVSCIGDSGKSKMVTHIADNLSDGFEAAQDATTGSGTQIETSPSETSGLSVAPQFVAGRDLAESSTGEQADMAYDIERNVNLGSASVAA